MRNLYRSLCLTALLAVVPTVLIGCGGGSSTKRSESKTRADLTFSVATNANVLKPLKARGLFKPALVTETGPSLTGGSGIYTFFDPNELPNRDQGDGSLHTYIVSNVNGVNRVFRFKRPTFSGISGGEEGSTYNFLNLDNVSVSLTNSGKNRNYSYLANVNENLNDIVSVIAHDGEYVTLKLTNVNLEPVGGPAANTPSSVKVNGTITYKLSDTQIIDLPAPVKAAKVSSQE